MSNIQMFNYQEHQVRTVIINGNPWFVAKDICEILGYANSRKTVADHVDEEDKRDGVTIRDAIGRAQEPTLVNESGLYSLILSSKLPSAKQFKHWVTSKVLPTIRETGSFVVHQHSALPSGVLEGAKLIFEMAGIKDNQLTLAMGAA